MNIPSSDLKSLLKRVSAVKSENITLTAGGVVAQDSDLTICAASDKLAGLPSISANARKISSVVNRMSGAVELTATPNMLRLVAGKTKVDLEVTTPKPHTFTFPDKLFTVPLAPLKDLLKYVSVAADANKAAATGGVVQLETVLKGLFDEEEVVGFEAMGTDGKRCAYASVEGSCDGEFKYHIPLPAVAALQGLEGEAIQIGESPSYYYFKSANTTVYANKLVKHFVNYKAVLPKSFEFTAEITVDEFRRVLHVVEPMLQESESNAVVVHFLDGRLHIKTAGNGSVAEDETTFKGAGEFRARFNHRFLSDYLATVSGDVVFHANEHNTPVVLESGTRKMLLAPVAGGANAK